VTDAPPFPRIPLVEGAPGASSDDLVLTPAERGGWFGVPVVIEEKLDGANVAIWRAPAGRLLCAGRGGISAMDRAGQFGRLRAWVAEHTAPLEALLGDSEVLYGEWLFLHHSVGYDRLPDWLVVLDLWSERSGFLGVAQRDERVRAAGLAVVPVVRVGPVPSPSVLSQLSAQSRFGSGAMEGLVLRREAGGRLVDRVKWLRPGFRRLDDDAWACGRPTNTVLPVATATPS